MKKKIKTIEEELRDENDDDLDEKEEDLINENKRPVGALTRPKQAIMYFPFFLYIN